MMVCLPSCNIDHPIYIWRIEIQLWQFYKRYPHLSPHLQIRPCLVHPYLPQPCAPPMSLSLLLFFVFYNKSNSDVPSAARPAEHASSPPSSPTESFIGVGVEKKPSWWWWCVMQCTGILLFFACNSKHHVDMVLDHFTTMLVSLFFYGMLVSLLVVSRCKLLPRVF